MHHQPDTCKTGVNKFMHWPAHQDTLFEQLTDKADVCVPRQLCEQLAGAREPGSPEPPDTGWLWQTGCCTGPSQHRRLTRESHRFCPCNSSAPGNVTFNSRFTLCMCFTWSWIRIKILLNSPFLVSPKLQVGWLYVENTDFYALLVLYGFCLI